MGTNQCTFPTFKISWSFGDTSKTDRPVDHEGLGLLEQRHHEGWVSSTGSFWSMNKSDLCQLFSQQGQEEFFCQCGMIDHSSKWASVKNHTHFHHCAQIRETDAPRVPASSKVRVCHPQRTTVYCWMHLCPRGYCFLKTRNFVLSNWCGSWS